MVHDQNAGAGFLSVGMRQITGHTIFIGGQIAIDD